MTRLTNAQKRKILTDAFLGTYSSDHLAERSKGFDGMLGIIIIPGDTIIIEECEKFALVLLKTLFVVNGYFTLIITLENILVETPNERFISTRIPGKSFTAISMTVAAACGGCRKTTRSTSITNY